MLLLRQSCTKPFGQLLFRSLNRSTKSLENFPNRFQQYHLITRNYGRKVSELKTPEVVYFPQILRWIKTKIGFKVLQKTWDPEFSEGSFIYGSKKAICRITEEISAEDKNDELKNLVTPALRQKLLMDIKFMSPLQKKVIILTPKDIKLLIPTDVRLQQLKDKRNCTIGLRNVAVKWQDLNGALCLVIIATQTEFIRDYSKTLLETGWTVRQFDILECRVIGGTKMLKK